MFFSGGRNKKKYSTDIFKQNDNGKVTTNDSMVSGNNESLNRKFENIKYSNRNEQNIDESTSTSTLTKPQVRSNSRSRSRSRSRSQINHYEFDSDSDSDDMPNNIGHILLSDTENVTNIDNDTYDYITSLSRINTEAVDKYSYFFIDNEIDYNLNENEELFNNDNENVPNLVFELVVYRINTLEDIPFLEFLLYYDKSYGKCIFPRHKRQSRTQLKQQFDNIMDRLFTTKFRYKGFIHDKEHNTCYVFYEKYFDLTYKAHLVLLEQQTNWLWVCSTEIINDRQYLNIPIDYSVVNMFERYPQIMFLQENFQNIELPLILYSGSHFSYTENISKFGLKREPITSRYGPFYYFTNFSNSLRWACYNYKNIFNILRLKEVSSSNLIMGEKYTRGGLSRYAVFTKNVKSKYLDDDYDVEKYKDHKKKKLESSRSHLNKKLILDQNYDYSRYSTYLDKTASLYIYDYSWTKRYDTIYNGQYLFDDHKRRINDTKSRWLYNIVSPFWCVYDYTNFISLTYHYIDTSNIPENYDYLFTDYRFL